MSHYESHLPEVAALLEHAAWEMRMHPLRYVGGWGVNDAIYGAWVDGAGLGSGRFAPEVLDRARDWLLRIALEWAEASRPISPVALVRFAAEEVRWHAREHQADQAG